MGFDIVVAHDLNQGIGVNNELPWQCSADMQYFKNLTTNTSTNKENTVIMGRKTWESIPEKFRPLPNRTNIVISTTLDRLDNAIVATSFNNALEIANSDSKIFVIGGAQIYSQALAHEECKTLYITTIFKRCDCDAFFPEYKNHFSCTYASNIWVSKSTNCAFFRYEKNKSTN